MYKNVPSTFISSIPGSGFIFQRASTVTDWYVCNDTVKGVQDHPSVLIYSIQFT
jgi:hypothetical protein